MFKKHGRLPSYALSSSLQRSRGEVEKGPPYSFVYFIFLVYFVKQSPAIVRRSGKKKELKEKKHKINPLSEESRSEAFPLSGSCSIWRSFIISED